MGWREAAHLVDPMHDPIEQLLIQSLDERVSVLGGLDDRQRGGLLAHFHRRHRARERVMLDL